MKKTAQILSLIFHPLFILIYSFLLLSWSNPFLFGVSSISRFFEMDSYLLLIIWLFIFTVMVPILSIFMMKGLGLISSIHLHEKSERIGPFIIVGMLYLVVFFNINNNPILPNDMRIFSLGSTIGLFTAFFINLFKKISIHMVGMGGLTVISFLIIQKSFADNEYIFALSVISSGMVGTSRIYLDAHEPEEVYMGFLVGMSSMFISLSIFS